jgi:hypothetical protein
VRGRSASGWCASRRGQSGNVGSSSWREECFGLIEGDALGEGCSQSTQAASYRARERRWTSTKAATMAGSALRARRRGTRRALVSMWRQARHAASLENTQAHHDIIGAIGPTEAGRIQSSSSTRKSSGIGGRDESAEATLVRKGSKRQRRELYWQPATAGGCDG